MKHIKNNPSKIYLQLGFCPDEDEVIDWKDLSGGDITWSEEQICKSDLVFISVDLINERIKELENKVTEFNDKMDGAIEELRGIDILTIGMKKKTVRGKIDELQKLLKT